jgi:tRNA pseudouridine13 synthase
MNLPYAHGGPPLTARLRATPDDFKVDELHERVPDGDGDHVWLDIQKRGANTDWVARELARLAGVKPVDVGYAGLKDRDAVTTQVFTVHLPGRDEPDWSTLPESVTVRATHRHRRKLKRGALLGNRFGIVLRDVVGDPAQADARLEAIKASGVPNYFGDQRFGRRGANVARAEAMFGGKSVDRATRSILLSAARSHLFNTVLAQRVETGRWNRALVGEIWSLAGSRAWFGPEAWSDALDERLASGDIHPSGPLWGRGALRTMDDALALELEALAPFVSLKEGLEAAGLSQDRRALRLLPVSLEWTWRADDALEVSFELPPGCYATVVLRELADTTHSSS